MIDADGVEPHGDAVTGRIHCSLNNDL